MYEWQITLCVVSYEGAHIMCWKQMQWKVSSTEYYIVREGLMLFKLLSFLVEMHSALYVLVN
jgi:hypothetical protein